MIQLWILKELNGIWSRYKALMDKMEKHRAELPLFMPSMINQTEESLAALCRWAEEYVEKVDERNTKGG